MATKFIEPGGDAEFGINLWQQASADSSAHWPAASSAQVHGGHQRSILYSNASTTNSVLQQQNIFADAGGRYSFYLYIGTYPSATNSIAVITKSSLGATVSRLRLTSTGVLQLWDASAQKGSNGATLSTGQWYRISCAYTITSTTVNQFRVWVNGTSSISVSNATIANTGSSDFILGNGSGSTVTVMYTSDHYVDDSSSLTDTGDVWVTAKRPNANGTSNQFTTQIGSGGSGYGTGHSPQVNERPESDTNGWSLNTISKATEEYNIESASTGDLSVGTVIDYLGWIRAAESTNLNTPTTHIIVNGTATAKTLSTTAAYYTQIAGSSTYPAGTGSDIGMDGQYASTGGTYSLYECGVVVAYTPSTITPGNDVSMWAPPVNQPYNTKAIIVDY